MEEPFLNLKPGYKKRIRQTLSNRVIHFIVIGGVLLVGVVLIGILFWYQSFVTKNFLKYVPVSATAYVGLRNSFWPWQDARLIDSPAAKDFDESMKQGIFPLASHAGLALVPIDGVLEKIYYFYITDKTKVNDLYHQYTFSKVINENILVVATNAQSLFKVQEVEYSNLQPLDDQVDKNLLGRGALIYYIDSSNTKAYLSKNDDIIFKIFTHLAGQDIYLSANKRNDHWRFNFNNNFSDVTTASHIIESIPEDFSLYLSGINLSSMLSLWQGVDHQLAYNIGQSADSLKTVYGFHGFDQLQKLFNQNIDLVTFDNSANFLGFNYVLAIDDFTNDQLLAFEEFIKIILSQKIPSQVSYILPDGSQVTELIANIDKWQWQDIDGNRSLSEPELDFSINYKIKDNQLFISSSRALLDRFDDNSINVIRLTSRCGFSVSNSIGLLVNDSSSFFPLLPDGLLALSSKSDSRVGGCIFNP